MRSMTTIRAAVKNVPVIAKILGALSKAMSSAVGGGGTGSCLGNSSNACDDILEESIFVIASIVINIARPADG